MRRLRLCILAYAVLDLLLGYAGLFPLSNSYAAGQQIPGQVSIVILGGGGTIPSFTVPPPSTPVVSVSTASGTLPAGQYSVRTAYVTANGPTLPSVSTLVTLTAAGTINVTSPVSPGTLSTTYNVYIGGTVGTETQQGSSTNIGTAFAQSGALGAGTALPSITVVPNGSTSAGNLTAAINQFALLAEKGPRFSVNSAPAVSVLASASQAAGGVGVRNVADCVSFSAGSTTAPAVTQLNVNLRDGASGAGTVKASWTLIILAATGQNVPPFQICGLNIVGTANTAMTLEFSSLLTNLFETATLTGFAIQ